MSGRVKKLHPKEILELAARIPQPTKLDIDRVRVAAFTCRTVQEFCNFLEVDTIVFKQWCKQSLAYYRAYNSWREFATADIEVAMAKRAIGFTKKTKRDIITKEGIVVTLENETYYPPSETAGQFWLKNRSPEDWKDKSEVDINVQANIRAWLVAAGEAPQAEAGPEAIEGDFRAIEGHGSIPMDFAAGGASEPVLEPVQADPIAMAAAEGRARQAEQPMPIPTKPVEVETTQVLNSETNSMRIDLTTGAFEIQEGRAVEESIQPSPQGAWSPGHPLAGFRTKWS